MTAFSRTFRGPARDPRGRRLAGLVAASVLVILATAGTAAVFAPARQPPPIPGRTVAASAKCPAARSRTATARAGGVRPVLAVIGASFSAGTGARAAAEAWPADLGRMLHLRVEVSATPGAGFITAGRGHRGPFAALAGRLNLAQMRPVAVLIQGGHNDIGRPVAAIDRSVRGLVDTVRCLTPGSRIGIVSVFSTGDVPSPKAVVTDRAIVAAARAADPRVLVFDPIAEHWRFPRVGDQLHPTPAGHRWIAAKVAAGLRAAGVGAAAPKPTASA